jgi:putative membrane protein
VSKEFVMKKTVAIMAVLLVTAWTALLFAQTDQAKSVEMVLNEIRQSQGISDKEPIACDKVTNAQLEELGAAVMRLMHPNPQEYRFMNRMIGEEGSPTLRMARRVMGARYLGCFQGDYAAAMGPAVAGWGLSPQEMPSAASIKGGYSPGAMGLNYGRHTRSNGNYGGMSGFWYGGLMMWILYIAVIVLIVVFIWSGVKRRERHEREFESALEILKKRYARGEITKEQFDEMKRDL